MDAELNTAAPPAPIEAMAPSDAPASDAPAPVWVAEPSTVVEPSVAEPMTSAEPIAEPSVVEELDTVVEPVAEPAVDDKGSTDAAIVINHRPASDWPSLPLLITKRPASLRKPARATNHGMAPRRFIPLSSRAQKPTPAQDEKKETRDARVARGTRRALWIIAIATAVNAGVAGLQWYEIHRVSPARQASNAMSTATHLSADP
jgi:hypothetical protein